MAKAKILIIDDDSTVANAISEAFIRAGFDTLLETKGKSALSTLRVEKVDGVVVDCMIPGINGVDLALKMREEINYNKKIVLISGIFKDKKFAENSIKKAAANDFLFKPLDLSKLVAQFDDCGSDNSANSSSWTDKIIQQNFLIESEEFIINKVDLLPFIQELKSKGETVSLSVKNHVFTISSGSVVDVKGSGKSDSICKYVVNKGYTSQDIINKFIDKKMTIDICEQLLDKSIISPHLRNSILNDYYLKTINNFLFAEEDDSFIVKLEKTSDTKYDQELTLRNEDFIYFDYVENQFKRNIQSYIKTMQNVDYQINRAVNSDPIMTLPFMQAKKASLNLILKNTNIKKLVGASDELTHLQTLYFLHIKGFLNVIPASISDEEIINLEKRLKLMLKGVEGNSPEQIFKYLGVEDTRAIFVTTFFKSFAKLNHPDKLPQSASNELKKLNQEVFSIVSEAHGILTDPVKKEAYKKEVNNKKAEVILEAERLKEEGQSFLSRSKYKEALGLFTKAREIHTEPMLTLYFYWCHLKINKKIEDKKIRLDIYNELVAFEIEDKRNELYSLVMGIFYKRSKKYEDAVEEFEKALGYNKNFLPARRELMNLKNQLSKSGKGESLLTGDISTVVSGFFKKKA